MCSRLTGVTARERAAPWSAADAASSSAEGDHDDDDTTFELRPPIGSAQHISSGSLVKPEASLLLC